MEKPVNHRIQDAFDKSNQNLRLRENLHSLFQIGNYFHVVFNVVDSKIEFCSDNIDKILGYDCHEFSRHLLIENIHPDDLPIFLKHETKITEFYKNLSLVKIPKYKVRFDVRVRNKLGVYKRLMRQVLDFRKDDAGNLQRSLSVYTDISYLKKDTSICLSILGVDGEPSYTDTTHEANSVSDNPFSERELQVLKLLGTGVSIKQMAKTLNLSQNTINNHRYNMLLKADVHSSPGLLGKAFRNGWID